MSFWDDVTEVFDDVWDAGSEYLTGQEDPLSEVFTETWSGDLGGLVNTVSGFLDGGDDGGGGGVVRPVSTGSPSTGGGGRFMDQQIRGGPGYINVGGGGVVSRTAVAPIISAGVANAGRWAGRIMRWGGARAILSGNGLRMTAKEAWQMVNKFGPQVVAGALGWTVPALLAVLFDSGVNKRRRRRRGVSARDIRTTKRVIRFANRLTSELAGVRGGYRRSKARGASGGGVQVVRAG